MLGTVLWRTQAKKLSWVLKAQHFLKPRLQVKGSVPGEERRLTRTQAAAPGAWRSAADLRKQLGVHRTEGGKSALVSKAIESLWRSFSEYTFSTYYGLEPRDSA